MQKLQTWARKNGISKKDIPEIYLDYINLKKLDLRDRDVSEIIEDIFSLKNLEKLRLRLTSELPTSLNKLINLETLDLNNSQINTIPKEVGELTKLKKLFIASSDLKSLPEEITSLKNLTFFDLALNQDLKLTTSQIKWIHTIREKGCEVDLFGTKYSNNM